jgi:alanine dehydrogenase
MIIGVPKEIKNHEYRVGLRPESVLSLVREGHDILLEKGAGHGIGISDYEYKKLGSKICMSPDEVFNRAELVIKVKEPQPDECDLLRSGQILFTFLHLSADKNLTDRLLSTGVSAIAYETVTNSVGQLPLLYPMSEVAGKLSVQAGARCLEKPAQGRGLLLGGVSGVAPSSVLIIGGGVVGDNAAIVARGMGADVTVIDTSMDRIRYLTDKYNGSIRCLYSAPDILNKLIKKSDLVIGAVLVPGAAAPKIITSEMVSGMKPGSVIVDVAIDQGGCCEGSRPTTHESPTFIIDDVVYYCVANMPGAVPETSTLALNNATLPYISKLAKFGLRASFLQDEGFSNGLNVHNCKITNAAVAANFGYDSYLWKDVV